MYKVLKKITPIMLVITIAVVLGVILKTRWPWKEMNLQFVTSLPIQQVSISNDSAIYSLPSVNANVALGHIEDAKRCCIEIHTEKQWQELVEIWGIEEGDYTPEFPGYYIVSLGWEICGLRYREVDAGKISYGEIEKEGNYQSGMIYIYRFNDDVPLSYIDNED